MFGKLSIAALVSALAVSAAAAPAPAPSGDKAPAAPATQDKAPDMQGVSSPTNRIVNSVNCTKGFQHSGSLSVDGKGAVSMQGNPQVLTLGGDALKVHFSECTSETMNNKELAPQDAKSHNGLIKAGNKCLRASRLGETTPRWCSPTATVRMTAASSPSSGRSTASLSRCSALRSAPSRRT